MHTSISASNPLAGLPSFTPNTPSSSPTTVSFAQQLAAALENYLGKSGSASGVQVNIQPTGSQASGNRQFLVTVTDTPPAPATPSSDGTPQRKPVTATLMNPSEARTTSEAASPTEAPATTASASTTPAASIPVASAPSASATLPTNEQDAYWATQPPEVQVLRTITDENERGTVAKQLADKGFLIDVPIMVWHWDPLVTMTIRQNSGYTWVPSGDQAALPSCPNCDMPGLPHYDPNNPPANSITVSTAWAKGLESTAPWHMG